MELPARKHVRLKEYDYSQNGAYFVTICAAGRRKCFGHIPSVGRAGSSRPTQLLPRIVAALKRFTKRDAGCQLWQSGYHEHIIRDDNDFLLHWQYIDQNPARWNEDEYYAETAGGAP